MTSLIDISASMQDYLETILEIEQKEDSVRVTDIANKLNIAKASVNQTIKKLKNMGLVKHQTYGPVELTNSGKEIALKVRRRHILIKEFLIEVLGVEPKIAENDACLMEHVVSRQTMEKLTTFLVNNEYIDSNITLDNNTNQIEEKEVTKMSSINTKALSELGIGEKGKVTKITSKGALKKRILEMGIITGTEVIVKGFAPFKDPMEILVKGYKLSLRKEEAANIFVEVL